MCHEMPPRHAASAYRKCVILPAREIERCLLLVLMLGVEIVTNYLETYELFVLHRQHQAYLKGPLCVSAHTIVRLDPLSTEVDSSGCPMHVVVVDGNQDHVFAKDVNLLRVSGMFDAMIMRNTFFVHFASLPFSYPSLTNLAQKKEVK
jgi:hypothetical protein